MPVEMHVALYICAFCCCALLLQIFEGIRDFIVQSVELKFNCFFLMPLVDTFPQVQYAGGRARSASKAAAASGHQVTMSAHLHAAASLLTQQLLRAALLPAAPARAAGGSLGGGHRG